jgi:hypothetical protein
MEEVYIQVGEQRGIDPGHEVLQIFADPFKRQPGKNREESECLWRRTSAFWIRATFRGFEFDVEGF